MIRNYHGDQQDFCESADDESGRHWILSDAVILYRQTVNRHFMLARECGFDNINMDLIVGLPGEDREMVRHTLDEVTDVLNRTV